MGRGGDVTTAFVFPGQGSQAPGMLSDLPQVTSVRQTLAEAGQLIPGGIDALDQPGSLADTVHAQLALLVCGVAATRALAGEGAVPDIVAGHSVGAFAAAVAAGVLEFGEAITAVTHRARRMAELFPHGYGMLAISGLGEAGVGAIAEQATQEGHPAWLANVNSFDQMVVTGTTAALDRCSELARAVGARQAKRLSVAVPSHAPILKPVSAELQGLLSGLPERELTAMYIMISTARPARTMADVLDDLAMSVSQTVRWRDVFGVIAERGTRFVLQLPPGRVLVGLALSDEKSRDDSRVEVRAMSDTGLADSALLVRRGRGAQPDQVTQTM
jgi:malonate decarboxylase epsilon subunit